MYNPTAVANYFIDRAKQENVELTPMKLVKLVYIAHGWYLALANKPLINESVQAWKYGPVIQSLYYATKTYGNKNIDRRISPFGMLIIQYHTISDGDENAVKLLDKVWEVYKKFSGTQLSTLTHESGTPWDTVWNVYDGRNRYGAIIPDDLIKEHYLQKLQPKD